MRVLEIIFGKYFSALFSLFFRFFLCEVSGRCFWLSEQCGCFVRTFLLLVLTGVLVRSLMWHYVRTTLMFCLDGEPCRVKSHSHCAPGHSFLSLWFFVSLCVFLCSFYVYFSHALVLFVISLHPRYVSLRFYCFL